MRTILSFVFLFVSLCTFTHAFSINLKLVSCNPLDQGFYKHVFCTIKKLGEKNIKDLDSRATLFEKKIKEIDADIICLQEYLAKDFKNAIDKKIYDIKEYTDCYLAIAYKRDRFEPNMVLYVKKFAQMNNKGFMLLTLKDIKSGKKLGIVNAHLLGGNGVNGWQALKKEEKEFWEKTTIQKRKKEIYYAYRINQLEIITKKINAKTYNDIDNWIICGDFNLNIEKSDYTNIEDEILKLDKNLIDIDKEEQKSTCIGSDGNPQRLDYIFYKGKLNKLDYKVDLDTKYLLTHTAKDTTNKEINEKGFSDHSPITATLTYKEDPLTTALALLKAKLLSLAKTLRLKNLTD